MISANQLHEIPGEVLRYIQGPLDKKVQKILPPDRATADSLVFASKSEHLEAALKHKAPIIIAHQSLTLPPSPETCFFSAPNIQMAIATAGPLFDKKIQRFHQEEHIHPKSFIHPTSQIGKNVIVGPFVTIGAEVHIGDHSIIGAGTVIENHARVGRNTILHPQTFIGAYCEVGSYCEIHPHTTVGSDGFGFVPLKNGHPIKIPQLGRVIIEDHVEIGSNCAIDRAAMTETRIRAGAKLDNLCHIAHNCEIGENSLIAAGFMMAGSSKVGKNFAVGGGSVVSDHIEVTDNVMVAGLSGVTNDINEPGQYGGYPLQPLKDSLKTIANTVHLTKMRKTLNRIIKHLNLSEE